MIRTNSKAEELHTEGEEELVLVGVTYEGRRSVYNSPNIRDQGGYPSLDGFPQGVTKLVRLPSSKLGWWEQHQDFTISYDEATLAEAVLESNYLPEGLIGPNIDPDFRDSFCDNLGISPAATEEEWREKLAEVAGIEEDDEEAEAKSSPGAGEKSRKDELSVHDRSDLIKVANSYDDVDDFKEEHDLDSVSHAPQSALAEYLAGKEEREVNKRIEQAQMGNEI